MNFGERTLAGSNPGLVSANSASRLSRPVQLVGAERHTLADLCRLEINRELTGLLGTQASGTVVPGKAGQRGQQRAVVIQWFGHLVVEALVILALDTVVPEPDLLGDQDSGTGVAVVVGELSAGHGNPEPRCAGQRREEHL